jgi:sugar/nucleoside kinase (ribokinase family)
MSFPPVVCVGLATADIIVSLPSWPRPDGRLIAERIVRSAGGPAATAAVTLARLGHQVAMVGAVGDDEAGERLRTGLSDEGVDVEHLVTLPGATAESVILLDASASTRSILHAPGVSLASARMADFMEDAAWIHADHAGYMLVRDQEPARLSVDGGHHIESLELSGLGLYAPSRVALLDRYPGRRLEDAVRAALDEGAVRVVVTLGADGALAAEASGAWRIPGISVDPVSTLGAGDVFHGGLLASLLDGLELHEAARRANVAAVLSCGALDGRGAIPTRSVLDAAVRDAPRVEPVMLGAAS